MEWTENMEQIANKVPYPTVKKLQKTVNNRGDKFFLEKSGQWGSSND